MIIGQTKRITIDDIKPTLKEYNLKLRTGSFCIVNNRCRPLSVIAVGHYKTTAIDILGITKYVEEVYGEQYINGFWSGFDGCNYYSTDSCDLERLKQGYEDGKLLREQLKDIIVTNPFV